MRRVIIKMSFFSKFYNIEVRDEIAKEFTDSSDIVDDMMAGLHEIRAKLSQEDKWLKDLNDNIKKAKIEHANKAVQQTSHSLRC